VLVAVMASIQRYQSNQKAKKDATGLIGTVYDKLGEYAEYQRASGHGDGFVSVNQLRDDVLRGEVSSARRKKLWGHVEHLVEENANVRTKFGALDSGDVGRGWKWIGDTGSRRESSRLSIEHRQESSPMTELMANGSSAGRGSFTRWNDDVRPQY